MRLVIDANVLFSALLREGTTRRLLAREDLELYAPVTLWDELERHEGVLLARSKARPAAFRTMIQLLRDRVTSIGLQEMADQFEQAERWCQQDPDDAVYLAAALTSGLDLWTHDKQLAHAARAAGLRAWTTAELLVATG